jgi:hypothetical protein
MEERAALPAEDREHDQDAVLAGDAPESIVAVLETSLVLEEEDDDVFSVPLPTATQHKVEVALKSRGEIVSSIHEATLTRSEADVRRNAQQLYGDLPEALWEGRPRIEQRWMVPSDDHDTIVQCYSDALTHPDRCIVVGTNGVISAAWYCLDTNDARNMMLRVEQKERNRKERAAVDNAILEHAAENNVALHYKLLLRNTERRAFYAHMKHVLETECLVTGDVKLCHDQLLEMAKSDPVLTEPVSKLGPVVSQLWRALPATPTKAVTGRHKAAPRPGNAYASVKVEQGEFLTPPPVASVTVNDNKKKTTFRLRLCATPTDATKRTHWADADCVIETAHETVPCAALNDSHIAILFLPSGGDGTWAFKVELWELPTASALKTARAKPRKQDEFWFSFHESMDTESLASVHLSADGIFVVGFSCGAVVFDTTRRVPGLSYVLLGIPAFFQPEALTDEAKGRLRRTVTCVGFHRFPPAAAPALAGEEKESSDGGGMVLLGTAQGETYGVDWRTGNIELATYCSALEPVFSTRYCNGRHYLHTVTGVMGWFGDVTCATATGASHVEGRRDTMRPVAHDSCGSLLFMLSKYGSIQILSTKTFDVVRQIEWPKEVPRPRCLSLQHAYPGIKAYPERLVAVSQDGRIRNILLATKTPAPSSSATPPKPKTSRRRRGK